MPKSIGEKRDRVINRQGKEKENKPNKQPYLFEINGCWGGPGKGTP